MKTKRYFYRIIIHWCPVCGRETKYRTRVLEKVPVDLEIVYDWCDL